ncbi:MAG TPA: dinitrogenase iron-molybdenum cofactor biosynthesis protein [Anaerolineae bacterium]|nr:dinitrogenase iron-molybdenum cofactor biosynthesis protein [Anaerolineae bacterium]
MKVAITAGEPNFEAKLEPRFGRCAYFLIVETETQDWKPMQNPAADAMGGAGPQAAQFLADQGVEAVISGEFGPNAYTALEAAGIRMFRTRVENISSLFEKFLTDQLEPISGPTSPQRHGGRRARG